MSDKRFGRPPEWAVDAGTVLAVLIAHALPFLVTTRTAAPEAGWTPAQYLPVLLISVPLYWRRRYPLVVLSLVLLGSGLYLIPDPDTAPQPIAYGVLVALYSVAEDRRAAVRRGGLAILVAAMLIQVVDVVLHQPSLETASRSILLLVAVWFLGRAVAGRRELTEREREERKREAGRAAVRERERIARDMVGRRSPAASDTTILTHPVIRAMTVSRRLSAAFCCSVSEALKTEFKSSDCALAGSEGSTSLIASSIADSSI